MPEDTEKGAQPRSVSAMLVEEGTTGLNKWGGKVSEEFLPELQGAQGYEKYREMRLNCPMVGAVLFAIEQVLLSPAWDVTPGEGPDGKKAAQYVKSCLHDMYYTWPETLAESLSFLPYGFCLQEIVLKLRQGPQPGMRGGKPLPPSQYNDRKYGWHKFAIRGQETIDEWKFGPHGEVYGVYQVDPYATDFSRAWIPRSKLLHFKARAAQGNPEGRSVLRTAYRPYFFLTRLEEIEGIAIERNAAGTPVLTPPQGVDIFADTEAMRPQLAYAKRVVTGLRKDEHQGVVKPFGWVLELLSPGQGSGAVDAAKAIERHAWNIARCVLAQFLEQGRQVQGSYAAKLSDVALFLRACKGWLEIIRTEIQRQAVVPLVTVYNHFDLTKPPELTVSDVTERGLEDVADSIAKLTSAGWLTPDQPGENLLRERAGLPAPEKEKSVEERESKGKPQAPGTSSPSQAGKGAGEVAHTRKSVHEIMGLR